MKRKAEECLEQSGGGATEEVATQGQMFDPEVVFGPENEHDQNSFWLPNNYKGITEEFGNTLKQSDSLPSLSLSRLDSSNLYHPFSNDVLQWFAFHNPSDQDLKSFSFESQNPFSQQALNEATTTIELEKVTAKEKEQEKGMVLKEPRIVPVATQEDEVFAPIKCQPSLNVPSSNFVNGNMHTHNLRPRRNTRRTRTNFTMLLDSDESGDDEHGPNSELNKLKSTDKTHPINEENKENNPNLTLVPKVETKEPVKRKKRAYYRKNKYPKEVLEKIEAERLKKKRLKNRELAARSRRRKKERMQLLEKENEQLKTEVARLNDRLASCTCHAMKSVKSIKKPES